MAGGMLAASLAEQPLNIVLLDAAPAPQCPRGEPALRVSALTETSETLLQRAEVWSLMPADRLQPYEQMEVRDGDGTGEVHFSAADAGASHLGTLVENDAVVAALYQRCLSLPRVEWRNDCRVSEIARAEDGWRISLSDGEVLQTRLLVGADGARSMVRSAAGLQAQPHDTGHVAIVATLKTQLPHQRCARQAFLDSGPVALLPLYGDGHSCSLVWSLWPERAQQLLQLSPQEFSRELTRARLGFAEVHEPVTAVQLSRGKAESHVLFEVTLLMQDLGRLATDLVLFYTQEFAYVTLPAAFTTGSSIMPQKRNPDVFELIRGRSATSLACLVEALGIFSRLPSGYHRDLQLIKAPLFRGIDLCLQTLDILPAALEGVAFRPDRIRLDPSIHAAERAYALVVEEGIPFREAYLRVARELGHD